MLNLKYFTEIEAEEIKAIEEIVIATGFFSEEEVAVATSLVKERLEKKDASGYFFILVKDGDRLVGFTCFGPIPCTQNRYDLYWIVVHPDYQGRGIGKILLQKTEKAIKNLAGEHLYIETSNRLQYVSTRAFYERCGYKKVAIIPDFYARGDDKVIYFKKL
ncbi:MAG: Deacetylase, histone deacetylase/acetoin utilization protein [Desulfonauticus sp. 38_4375]|nr:MAG: Deacetylase, histone deacetylase/acetoin utilization protein [Desulfonauticus sp. 38_4375]